MDTLVRMAFEVGFCHFDRRMAHGIADQFGLEIVVIGQGGPTVACGIAAQVDRML